MYPTRDSFTIPDAPSDSLERRGIGDNERARISLFAEGDAGAWWRTPCVTRSFCLEEETLVPAEQFDAALVARDVRPAEWIDPELVRRVPLPTK